MVVDQIFLVEKILALPIDSGAVPDLLADRGSYEADTLKEAKELAQRERGSGM